MEETWSQENKITQLNHVWANVELHDKRLCLSKEMRLYEVIHKHMHTRNDLYNTYHNCQKEQLTMAIVWRHSPACVQCSIVCPQCISNCLLLYIYFHTFNIYIYRWEWRAEDTAWKLLLFNLVFFFWLIKVEHHVHSRGRKFELSASCTDSQEPKVYVIGGARAGLCTGVANIMQEAIKTTKSE